MLSFLSKNFQLGQFLLTQNNEIFPRGTLNLFNYDKTFHFSLAISKKKNSYKCSIVEKYLLC